MGNLGLVWDLNTEKNIPFAFMGLIVSPNEEHAVELVRKEEARRDKLSSLP